MRLAHVAALVIRGKSGFRFLEPPMKSGRNSIGRARDTQTSWTTRSQFVMMGAFIIPEEEAEYPAQLCRCYARGAKAQLEKEKVFEAVRQEEREAWYQQQLEESTARLSVPEIAAPVAAYLANWELSMTRGTELDHLRELLRSTSMRGTDVRFFMQLGNEEEQHEVPYPVLRKRWRTKTSYRWRQEGHINELEINARVVMSRRRGRNVAKFGKRWMHVLDSMVSRGALTKGSSSVRINRPLRKHAAHSIAQDNYLFLLWTISGWNFSDKASHQ